MEQKKANDILVATINNPHATTYDLMSIQIDPDNTSLLSKDEYKQSDYIKKKFQTPEGKFDEVSFDRAYNLASQHYFELGDEKYLKSLDQIQYSPFDVTRPKDAKTYNIEVSFSKDYNPFKQLYSREGLNSITEGPFSVRELAQQSKVFDPKTNTWSEKSANDLSFFKKLLGDTLVYAQYDEDGTHLDYESGREIAHKKGDWKINEEGNVFLEKLNGREVYGRQVVNPMDMLTVDGSVMNRFDVFDSDSKEKSAAKVALKLGLEIAPFLIPVFNTYYGGVKAAIGLASVMPTFYKSMEGILLGDNKSAFTDSATAAEGYLSKFTTSSVSDEGQRMTSFENVSQMVGDIFAQIYEQRAMASLSKYIVRPNFKLAAKEQEYLQEINQNIIKSAMAGKIDISNKTQVLAIRDAAIAKLPELQAFQKAQSQMSKALSLGYMALTSTSDIYGEALQGGYDRRTAGFASLMAAAGQYGVMMNNRMGDWFLDKTTGYNVNVNKALIRKATKEYLEPVKTALASKTIPETKRALGNVFKSYKNKLVDIFTSPSEIGEALFKHAFIEGVEEVTEQAVLDMTKGVIDTLSYLGLTKDEGTFGGWSNVFSKEGLQNYLANFVGGILGGAMFELNTSKIEPLLNPKIVNKETKKSLYQLIGNGHAELIIKEINKQRPNLGNNYVTPPDADGNTAPATKGISQADKIADFAISMVRNVEGLMNASGTVKTDSEIIRRAMTDHLIIQDLEKSKGDNKIGIEGLIVDDFRRTAELLTEKQLEITNLTKGIEEEGKVKVNTDEIKVKTAEVNELQTKINSILAGEKAGDYYNQMMMYLVKEVSEPWLNIDKEIYTRAKYQKEFSELPTTGLGLTQNKVEAEWREAIESKDLRKHIEVVTNAYLELEQIMNPIIDAYFQTGYSAIRAETYKNLIDLDYTIKMFNTATSDEEKSKIFERFMYINERLQQDGSIKLNLLPWEVYKLDFAKHLLSFGMVAKAEKDENGNIIIDPVSKKTAWTPYTDEELNKPDQAGVTHTKKLESMLNIMLAEMPINPFNADTTIDIINEKIKYANLAVDRKLATLLAKVDPTEEELAEIEQLKNSKYDFVLLPFSDSAQTIKIQEEFKVKIANLMNEAENTMGINKDLLEKYTLGNFYNLDNEEHAKELEGLKWLLDVDAADITEEFVQNLSEEQVVAFEASILNSFLRQEKDLYNRLLEAKKDLSFGKLVQENQDILDTLIEDKQVLENELKEEIEKLRPEILKMRNYALDLLLDELTKNATGTTALDGDIRNKAEKMITDMVNEYNQQYFPDIKFDSIEDVVEIFNTAKDIMAKLKASPSFNKVIEGEEEDQDIIFLDYSEEALIASNLGDVATKYITNSVGLNRKFLDGIQAIAELSGGLVGLEQLNTFVKLKASNVTVIDNDLYKLLEKLELSLQLRKNPNAKTVFSILNREEKALMTASSVSNLLNEGIKLADIQNAINVIKLVRSAVFAMSTTQIGLEDPYGFILSRQNFMKKNNIDSDVTKLKTTTSDVAQLMSQDLDLLETKLQFYLDLSKHNAFKLDNEQKAIRERMNNILNSRIKTLVKTPHFAPIKDRINTVYENNTYSVEKKILEIEQIIYEHFSTKDRKQILKDLLKDADIKVSPGELTVITKDIKAEDYQDYDFAVYLATILTVSSKDFNLKMKNLLDNFDKSPFYTQEQAVKVAYASLVDPELFGSILDLQTINQDNNVADLITFVLGVGGSGKTSVVFKMLVKYLQANNKTIDFWAIAPALSQAEKLHGDILSGLSFIGNTDIADKIGLYDKMGIKEEMIELINDLEKGNDDSRFYSWKENHIILNEEALKTIVEKAFTETNGNQIKNIPNLIFIDEVTHFSSVELEVLNAIIKKLQKNQFIKIIAAGDTTQSGFKYGSGKDAIELNVDRITGIYTPKLYTAVRPSNVWTRENKDLVVQLSSNLTKIFWDGDTMENGVKVTDEENAKRLLEVYKQKKLFELKYHRTDKAVFGELIIDSLNDSIVNTLKNVVNVNDDKNTKILGIVTEDGSYDSYKPALVSMGLLGQDGTLHPRVKIYSMNNIQGNESDYFIFDTKVIKSERLHHVLKDFYTLISRSKDATIIIDSVKLSEKFNIINSAQTPPDIRQPLNDDVIKQSREQRIATLTSLLEGYDTVKFDRFMFSSDLPDDSISESLVDSVLTEADLNDFPPDPDSSTEEGFLEDNHNYMFHTFYNNGNTQVKFVTDKQGKIVDANIEKITFDANGTNTDLNISKVSNTEDVITGWTNIKNYFLFNEDLPTDKFSAQFLKSVFGSGASSTKVKTETVITASLYNRDKNTPLFKEGFDINRTLQTGDPFINLSLKLTYNNKVHYITLATISANTIEKSFGTNSKSFEDYSKQMKKLSKTLVSGQIIELKQGVKWKQITSLRYIQGGTKTFVKNLTKHFKGLKVSKLNFYPTTEPEFFALLNKYSFGEKRTIEDREITLKNGTKKTILGMRSLFKKYKGKPYIIASFNSTDLNGSTTEDVQAKIIPIITSSRSFNEAKAQIEKLRELYFPTAVADGTVEMKVLSTEDHAKVSATFKNTVSTTQMIQLLIELSEKYPDVFDSLLTVRGPFKDSILGLISKVGGKTKKDNINTQMFKVFETIKKFRGKDVEEIRKEVWPLLVDNTWKNYIANILILDKILPSSAVEKEVSVIYAEMRVDIDNFYNSLKAILADRNEGLYWETPKKGEEVVSIYDPDTTSDVIKILNEYQPEHFLYTKSVMESPRLLIDLADAFAPPKDGQGQGEGDTSNVFNDIIQNNINSPATKWKAQIAEFFADVTSITSPELQLLKDLLERTELSYQGFEQEFLGNEYTPKPFINTTRVITKIANLSGKDVSNVKKTILNIVNEFNCKN